MSAPPRLLRRFAAALRDALSDTPRDYTTGSIHRGIVLLAIPMVLEMAMESVFAVVDMYFVAHLGAGATAAVGLTESVATLLYALAIGLGMGTTATVARRVGEGNHEAAADAALQAIVLACALSLLIAIPGVLFAPEILALMKAEPETVAIGSGYTRMLLGGNAVIMLLFVINAAYRGAGDASIAMRSLWIANAVNIVLAPCLVTGWWVFPELGVTGAAIGTTIGRGTGVCYQLWRLRRGSGRLHLPRGSWRIDGAAMLRLLRVSAGGIGQFLIATASWIVVMRIVSSFGTDAVAGYAISVRVLMFVFLPAWGLSNAAATLVGQNLGAQRPDRAESAVWATGLYTMAFLAVAMVVCLAFGPRIIAIFTTDAAVVAHGTEALRIISYGWLLYAWGLVMMQAFNGAGDTMTPTKINLLCFWVVQIPVAWALAHGAGLGPAGVFWAVMGTESLLAVVSVLVFRRGRWKQRTV